MVVTCSHAKLQSKVTVQYTFEAHANWPGLRDSCWWCSNSIERGREGTSGHRRSMQNSEKNMQSAEREGNSLVHQSDRLVA